MEGIQTIQALKAVQSSLPAQTTIPSDELVMLYATDGTPIAKISRDDLVKAVASVMASNSQNTFSKLLGVQANGTPMGIGASDLASVLGGVDIVSASTIGNDLNNFKGNKRLRILYTYQLSDLANSPVSSGMAIIFSYCYEEWDGIQLFLGASEVYYRSMVGGNWQSWHKITTS